MQISQLNSNRSRYSQVKQYVLNGITSGLWGVGERVPSENELVDLCKVSRMTARRALQELLSEGTLIRIQGKGSFVAEEKQQSSLLQIRSIASDIRKQGLTHHSELLFCEIQKAGLTACNGLEIDSNQICGHSKVLHFQEKSPIQLELRWVNLDVAPEYTQQHFTNQTPSEYLSSIAPVTEAEHQVEAILGAADVRDLLQVTDDEAILLLERKTWCNGTLVSYAKLYHPGKRYRLGAKFRTEYSNEEENNDL